MAVYNIYYKGIKKEIRVKFTEKREMFRNQSYLPFSFECFQYNQHPAIFSPKDRRAMDQSRIEGKDH